MKDKLMHLYNNPKTSYTADDLALFNEFKKQLNTGQVRAAQPTAQGWQVNQWVKQAILLGFRMGEIVDYPCGEALSFTDKSTYPPRRFTAESGLRVVPGGSSVRDGVYLGKGVIMMPPMYINTGAWVGDGTMVDSHALVGSCAQVGAGVHLSAGAQLGGVLEPIGARPVIIEDGAFVGGNTGIFEGVLVQKEAVIGAGVQLTASTRVYDAVNSCWLPWEQNPTIPAGAVVVPGSRPLAGHQGFGLYCPIIVKYKDDKTAKNTKLTDDLRR